jgi:hypothetical protein
MPELTYLDILEDYGTNPSNQVNQLLGEYSLSNAIALAEGTLPFVVLLQEPCNQADRVPYDAMVYGDPDAEEWTQAYKGSATLQEIECLAKEESCGRYDLHDLHVFDINTLLSLKIQSQSHNLNHDLREAHKTCWRMIKAKKPKVVLVLTTHAGVSKTSTLRQLGSSLKTAGSTSTINIEGHEVRVIHGFHPSVYLRDGYMSEKKWSQQDADLAREVLSFCVAQAFVCLKDERGVLVDGTLFKEWRNLVGPRQKFNNIEDALIWEELESLGF